MVVYFVQWIADKELTQGKGRITHPEWNFCFTVLCRNISDASFCLSYLFCQDYKGKFSLEDGSISFKRQKIDSRGFDANYLYLDNIGVPLKLSDLNRSLLNYYNKKFPKL